MENKNTIDEIRNTSEAYLSKIENESFKEEFSVGNLKITGKSMFLNGTELTKNAQSKIFGILRVKPSFGKYSDTMSEQEWTTISEKLKDLQGDKTLIAQYTNEGQTSISNIFTKNPKKKFDDGQSLRSYFDTICDNLGNAPVSYDLEGMEFSEKTHMFDVSLLDRDTKIDVFGDAKDLWNGGQTFTFTPVAFNTRPYFSRLICTNGMRSRQHGFAANIQQSSYNIDKISKIIQESIVDGTTKLHDLISASGQHLANNNVSLSEFYAFRNLFLKDENNPAALKIVSQYFNDSPIYKAYGMNLAEKSKKWKSTANTGINAYDFFNLLTWLGSHQSKTGLSADESRVLQTKASEFFFKDNLDLEDIATPVTVNYPRLQAMM